MKKRIQKWSVFIGKSMLWSLLLYVVTMAAVNWDEINKTITGKNKTTIVNNILPQLQDPTAQSPAITPANISHGANVFKQVITLLTGIAKTTANY